MEIFTGKETIVAEAKNLSQGGVGVALDMPVREQTVVGLSMFLVEEGIEDETTEPLNLRGQICWCTPTDAGGYLAGIRFANLQSAEQQKLELFLRRLLG
jgi:Tfp pilus assembly protein PilZ